MSSINDRPLGEIWSGDEIQVTLASGVLHVGILVGFTEDDELALEDIGEFPLLINQDYIATTRRLA